MTDTPATLDTDKKATPNPILVQLKQQQATIEKQEAMINKLTDKLTSTAYLEPKTPEAEPEIKTPEDLIKTLDAKFSAAISQAIKLNNEQIMPLIKGASPDSPLWERTKIAEELVASGKVGDMDTALELAEGRLAKEKAIAEAAKGDLDKATTDMDAYYASLGVRDSSSLSHDRSVAKESMNETLERNWQKSDMEAAVKAQEDEADIYGLPQHPGVEIIMEDILD